MGGRVEGVKERGVDHEPVEYEGDGFAVGLDRGAFEDGRHAVDNGGDAAGAGGERGDVVAVRVLEDGGGIVAGGGVGVADGHDLAVRDGGGEALELDKPIVVSGPLEDSHLPDGDGISVGGHADKTDGNGGDTVVERHVEEELDGGAARHDLGDCEGGRGGVYLGLCGGRQERQGQQGEDRRQRQEFP